MSRILLAAFVIATLPPLAASQAAMYEARVIKSSFSEGAINLRRVNARGCAVGTDINTQNNVSMAFLDDGVSHITLPSASGMLSSTAWGMLANGSVIGQSATDVQVESVPTFWDRTGQPHELRRLNGSLDGNALGGAEGVVLGASDGVPVKWTYGVVSEVPMPAGYTNGLVYAINTSGYIVGTADQGPGTISGFVVDPAGNVVAATTPPLESILITINAAGVTAGATLSNGVLAAVTFSGGQVHTAPMPPGILLSAFNWIGRDGLAVGLALGVTGGLAMIHDGTTMTDLATLLDPVTGAGITLTSASHINSLGQIACFGMNAAGEQIGVVLTPVPVPEGVQPGVIGRPFFPKSTDARYLLEKYSGVEL